VGQHQVAHHHAAHGDPRIVQLERAHLPRFISHSAARLCRIVDEPRQPPGDGIIGVLAIGQVDIDDPLQQAQRLEAS
jgi:hypothetical protein